MKKTILLLSLVATCAVSVFSITGHNTFRSPSSTTFSHTPYLVTSDIDPADLSSQIAVGYSLARWAFDSTMVVIGCDTAAINADFASLLAQVGAGNLTATTPGCKPTGLTPVTTRVSDHGNMNDLETELTADVSKCKVASGLITRLGVLAETITGGVINR